MPDKIPQTSGTIADPEKDEKIKVLTEEKNSLFRIISHDIKGPINQMFALLQLMEMEVGNIPENLKSYIIKLYQAVLTEIEMIKNLNDTRSLDKGDVTLNLHAFWIKKAIQQSIRNFSIHCRIKNINIEFNNESPDYEIMADRILFLKALDAVISNAIKFSVPGSRIIINYNGENGKVIINVLDEGPGIPKNEISLIFNKYQKLSTKPTMGEGTTGTGMYLALNFMKMLNGEIEVGTGKDRGLTVSLKIPDNRPKSYEE